MSSVEKPGTEPALDGMGVPSPPGERERILLVSADRLGDLVWTLPAISHIRRGRPDAHISFLASRYVGELLTDHPDVDALYTIERNTNSIGKWFHFRKFLRRWGREHPDTVVFFKEGHVGRSLRRRFDRSDVLSVTYRDKAERLKIHSCRVRMDLAEKLVGPHTGDLYPHLQVPPRWQEAARRRAAALGVDLGRCIGLHPGVNRLVRYRSILTRPSDRQTPRTWPVERWVDLARRLLDRGLTPLFTGSGAEAAICDEIIRQVGPGCAAATSGLHVLELAGLYAGAAGAISGDTGPGHLAAAVGTPVVSLFGPTNPAITGPVAPPHRLRILWHRIDCSPCEGSKRKRCPDARCIKAITVDEVMGAIEELEGAREKA